jgi:cation-transporting ATPase E
MKKLMKYLSRFAFLVTNTILFCVVILLYVFGSHGESLLLCFALCSIAVFRISQNIRAKNLIKKVRLFSTSHVERLERDGSVSFQRVEDIKKGDLIFLKTGDDVPFDGTVIDVVSVEVTEGIITAESGSLPKMKGDKIQSGSVITSGAVTIRVESLFEEARMYRMSKSMKTNYFELSLLQKEVARIVSFSTWLLFFAIVLTFLHDSIFRTGIVHSVSTIGALTILLIPQGFALILVLLFLYGSRYLESKDLLMQELGAVENLGRIKELCMDKKSDVDKKIHTYLQGAIDTSETVQAVRRFAGTLGETQKVLEILPFSSWRSYGAMRVEKAFGGTEIILAGAPETVGAQITSNVERAWLSSFLESDAKQGKRIFCLAVANTSEIKNKSMTATITPLAVFILRSDLRPGIQDTIEFFQERGVRVRILSGDSKETVMAIASQAGIQHTGTCITGKEMEGWTDEDYVYEAPKHALFARVYPEQKEKIIKALRMQAFTAMIGDGANDALALKASHVGIAMFDGSSATKRVASTILLTNSFTALPAGVLLSSRIIKSIELYFSLFLFPTYAGTILFLGMFFSGVSFPLSPLNVLLISLISIGFPSLFLLYWTFHVREPVGIPTKKSLVTKAGDFVMKSAICQSVLVIIASLLQKYFFAQFALPYFVLLMECGTGFIFFLFVAKLFQDKPTMREKRDLALFTLLEMFLMFLIITVPLFFTFFDMPQVLLTDVTLFPIIVLFVVIEIFTVYMVKLYREYKKVSTNFSA